MPVLEMMRLPGVWACRQRKERMSTGVREPEMRLALMSAILGVEGLVSAVS